VQVEIIKLYGSIELAPLVGLSDRIVDLAQPGDDEAERTGREETIAEITTRLIANRASLKNKNKGFLNIQAGATLQSH
jgi:ATP phosphoribosyltransferase